MDLRDRERRGAALAGVALVVVGVAALVVQQSGVAIGWPIWVVIPGLALLLVAVAIGEPAGVGLAVLGGMVTVAGLVLAVQEGTGAYASWAYAWALVAPGGVGVGLLVFGILTGRWDTARAGIGALVAGIAIFLVGYLFFEGILGIDGHPSSDIAKYVVPAALVVLGVLVILAAFLPPAWRGAGTSWGPASTAAAAARAVELAGATTGEISLAFGAGRLAITGPAAPGHLVDGIFVGGVRREDRGVGSVRLSTPGDAFWGRAWTGNAPFDWRVGLSAEVPLRLGLEVGAARTDADLSALRVTDLRLRTGAAETEVVLPAAAVYTRVEIEAGAASVRLRVPAGVAARIRSTVALGTTDVDTSRFPRDPLGGWASPDFASAANKADIEVRGGVGSVTIR